VITVLTELAPVARCLSVRRDLKSLIASQSPFGDFVLARGGRLLNQAISLAVALAILNAVLATLLQNARFFFSTGRDLAWHRHINDAFTRTHPRFHSPWIATLAAGGTSLLALLSGMNLLLVLTGTGIVLTYAGLCVATARRPPHRHDRARRLPHAVLSPRCRVIGLFGLAYILYTSWLDPDCWTLQPDRESCRNCGCRWSTTSSCCAAGANGYCAVRKKSRKKS